MNALAPQARETERPPAQPPEGTLLVAVVGRPHGVRGQLRLFPSSERPERLAGLTRVWLVPPAGELGAVEEHAIGSFRVHGRAALVTLEGLSSREAAAERVHWRVHALTAELPAWGPDEFGMDEVLGAELLDGAERVGEVVGLSEIAGRDYLEVDHDGRRVLVPAVKDWLIEFDRPGRRIVMRLPAGLLEA